MAYYLYQLKDIIPTRLAKTEMITDFVNKQQASIVRHKEPGTIPNFYGLDKISAQELALMYNIEIVINGSGVVEKQSPEAYTALKTTSKVILNFKSPEY